MKSGGYRTEFSLFFITTLALIGMLYFNDIIKYVRINELKIFLQRLNKEENTLDHINLVMKYKNSKNSYEKKQKEEASYLVEMRVNTILTSKEIDQKVTIDKYRYIAIPAIYLINGFRYITGKEPIKNLEMDKSNIYLDIAYYYERNNYYKKALEIYDKALKEGNIDGPTKASIILHQGFCHSIIGNYGKAKDKYTTVITEYGNESVAITAAILLKYLEGFISEIEKVLRTEKDSVNKGVKLYNLIAYRESLAVLNKVEKKARPQDRAKINYFKARCYEGLAKKKKAVKLYQNVIMNAPKSNYAKLANRRLYLKGSLLKNKEGKKIRELSLKNNKIIKDQTFKKMVVEEKKIKKLTPQKEEKNNLYTKTLENLEKDEPTFKNEDIKSYDAIIKKVDNLLEKQGKPKIVRNIPNVRKLKIFTNTGDIWVGNVMRETKTKITLRTMLGPVTIDKTRITKRERLD